LDGEFLNTDGLGFDGELLALPDWEEGGVGGTDRSIASEYYEYEENGDLTI
jgi:hypothetical protein